VPPRARVVSILLSSSNLRWVLNRLEALRSCKPTAGRPYMLPCTTQWGAVEIPLWATGSDICGYRHITSESTGPKLSPLWLRSVRSDQRFRPWLLWRRQGPALVGHRSRLCGKARCYLSITGMTAGRPVRCESSQIPVLCARVLRVANAAYYGNKDP